MTTENAKIETMPTTEELFEMYSCFDSDGMNALGKWQITNDDDHTDEDKALDEVEQTDYTNTFDRMLKIAAARVDKKS